MASLRINALQQKYLVTQAAARNGVPYGILAGVYGMESTWGQNVKTSSAGAVGPFQFIPSTAASYGYPLTNTPTIKQFAQQADAAAQYLAALFKQYGQSWDSALRAYSAGGYGLSQVSAKTTQLQQGTGAYSGGGVSPAAAIGGGAAVGLGAIAGGAGEAVAGADLLGGGGAAAADTAAAGTAADAAAAGTVASTLSKAAEVTGIATLVGLLTNAKFWVRVIEFIGAVLLLYLGLHALTGQSSSAGEQVKHVTRIIPV